MREDRKMNKKFKKFLKGKNAYSKYLKYTTSHNPPSLSEAFKWDHTPEGWGYWKGLHMQWLDLLSRRKDKLARIV